MNSSSANGPSYAQLLLSIDLGDEVAEVDPALIDTFVQTADFDEFLSGRCDLITGIKGSGKSALLLMGMNSSPANVRMVKAQPLRGPVIYETDLPTQQMAGSDLEDYYLERWLLHTALTVAYALLSVDSHGAVSEFLERNGLPADPHESEVGVWVSSGRVMRNVDINNMDVVNTALQVVDSMLEKNDEFLWILYDRLDDVTFTRPETEQIVLRGLLRAHIYVSRASRRVCPKLFLRSDILDRATLTQGLRNLDKVPALRLNMNARDVSLLLAKRFLRSDLFSSFVGPAADFEAADDESIKRLMAHILPSAKLVERRKPNLQELYGHYFYDTTDGSGRYSARNVLAYIRLALVQQRRLCEDRNLLALPLNSPVLSDKALHAAWVQLSENRLHSYVYAEFPAVRSFVERLEYGPQRYRNIDSIGRRFFGPDPAPTEVRTIVDMLKYCGVIGESGGRLQVGRVYRPALRCRSDGQQQAQPGRRSQSANNSRPARD